MKIHQIIIIKEFYFGKILVLIEMKGSLMVKLYFEDMS